MSEGIASVQAFTTIALPSGILDKMDARSLMKFPMIVAPKAAPE
jgi:inhibitor of KinA sporulation pathway (predicted exonuclease)